MKGKICLIVGALFLTVLAQAQVIRDVMRGRGQSDTTRSAQNSGGLSGLLSGGNRGGQLTAAEVANGLKEALEQGAVKGTQQLSASGGFLENAAVKILMPPEARQVESTLRSVGMGRQVDQVITSMNRAAEDAAKSAAPIFVNAIRNISIADAFGILRGGDTAATAFLRGQTTMPLTEAFRPVIESSLDKVNATRHWNTVFTNYNRIAQERINPDLAAYVTERALAGIFLQLAVEETNIRRNPAARTSDLMRRVFGNAHSR